MCAKNHLLIFSSFLDIWENVEWPRFFGPPGRFLREKCFTARCVKNAIENIGSDLFVLLCVTKLEENSFNYKGWNSTNLRRDVLFPDPDSGC